MNAVTRGGTDLSDAVYHVGAGIRVTAANYHIADLHSGT